MNLADHATGLGHPDCLRGLRLRLIRGASFDLPADVGLGQEAEDLRQHPEHLGDSETLGCISSNWESL